MMAACTVCRCPVPTTQRRRLYSPSSCHILPVIKRYAGKLFQLQDNFLPPEDNQTAAFVCTKCFSSFEKVLRLKKQAEAVESSLLSSMRTTGEFKGCLFRTDDQENDNLTISHLEPLDARGQQ